MKRTTEVPAELAVWLYSEPRREEPTQEHFYGEDTVVDAFIRGQRTAIDQQSKAVLSQLKRNFSQSSNDTLEAVKYLKEMGISVMDAKLRINSWDFFEVLLLVSIDDIIKEDFHKVYDVFTTIENRYQTSGDYSIIFHCTQSDKTLSSNALKADGYILSHKDFKKKK